MNDNNEEEEGGGNEGLEDDDGDNDDGNDGDGGGGDDDDDGNDYEDEDGGEGGGGGGQGEGRSLTEWKTLLKIDALESLWVQETAPGGTQWEMFEDLALVQGMCSYLRLTHSDF